LIEIETLSTQSIYERDNILNS